VVISSRHAKTAAGPRGGEDPRREEIPPSSHHAKEQTSKIDTWAVAGPSNVGNQ
jgi:hypothetical protein